MDTNYIGNVFSDVAENLTYVNLLGTHTFILDSNQYTITAEEMGYHNFDQWNEKGILK